MYDENNYKQFCLPIMLNKSLMMLSIKHFKITSIIYLFVWTQLANIVAEHVIRTRGGKIEKKSMDSLLNIHRWKTHSKKRENLTFNYKNAAYEHL